MIKKIKKFFALRCSLFTQDGVATLPTIIALAILILAAGIGITATSFTESIVSAGATQSLKALFYAEAGARDALMRIARNKNFSTSTHQIDFAANGCADNSGCARITVSAASSPKVIVSEGQAGSSIRKVQVDVTFDSSLNGEIQSVNWREIVD